VAAIICNQKGQILVGQRIGSHGAGESNQKGTKGERKKKGDRNSNTITGTWQLPGGHLDFGEEPLMCAKRETKEETDIDVKAVELVAVTNDVFRAENKHYITLYAFCEMQGPAVTPKVRSLFQTLHSSISFAIEKANVSDCM
jgi:ADP-ribose pyrophosphatase YjhB (NUDIX family)